MGPLCVAIDHGINVIDAARLFSQKPKPGMTDEDCSHQPEGVTETMLPQQPDT